MHHFRLALMGLFMLGSAIVFKDGIVSNGPATLKSTLAVTGATTLSSTLGVTGIATFSSAIRGADGTVGAPEHSFTNETNSGFYRNAASDLRFAVNGADDTFWGTGGFGVGVVPTARVHAARSDGNYQYKVERNGGVDNKVYGIAVSSVSGTPDFLIDDVTLGANRFRITTAGSVAIGGAPGSGVPNPSLTLMSSANQAQLHMNDGRAGAGNKFGAIIYDGGVNLSKPGWVFQNVTDTQAFSSNSTTIFRDGSIVIGGTSTANQISFSGRGTVVWNPGTLAGGGGLGTNTITITGAVAGADCIAGVLDPAPVTGHHVQCITTANTCNIGIRCQQAANCVFGSATFYCRVFNP